MHKWAVPLIWVLALGLAIPAGALAYDATNIITGQRTCTVWDGRGSSQTNFWVQLALVFAGFFIPLILILFPSLALCMQSTGGREPRLDPPHNRTAMTAIGLVVIFIATRAPAEIYTMMKLFQQSDIGFRTSGLRQGTPYMVTSFQTDMVISSIVYVACAIHPLLYFILNPLYRSGFGVVWNDLICNKDPVQVSILVQYTQN